MKFGWGFAPKSEVSASLQPLPASGRKRGEVYDAHFM
jgi:hypothetical protein